MSAVLPVWIFLHVMCDKHILIITGKVYKNAFTIQAMVSLF
jgi:hypothetical protein